MIPEYERRNVMNAPTIERDHGQTDEASLGCDVSDEALEAAAQATCATSGYWGCPTAE
jgi:hypothetical protein